MEDVDPAQIQCPKCHIFNPDNVYYCGHCGFKIKEPPLKLWDQIRIYLWSILAPPAGLWWLYKYRKHPDPVTRRTGAIAAAVTIVALVLTIWGTYVAFNSLMKSVNDQMSSYSF